MKKVCAVLLLLLFSVHAFADGCFPGEPCYYQETKKSAAMPAEPEPFQPIASPAEEMMSPRNFYVSLGAGYAFLEKDQEILGHQLYDLRFGAYRFAKNLSAELGVGIMPDIRRRQFTGGRFTLPDDTSGVRLLGELLFHLNDDADADIDPYGALGVGVNLYEDDLKNGGDAVFGSAGVGAFVNLNDSWFIKPDYRIMMVGEDTEVNHSAMLSLGYRFCL